MTTEHIKIGDVTPWVQYAGDGSQTQFDFIFPIFENDDLQVFLGSSDTPQAEGYAITGAGQSAGGVVTFDTPPALGLAVTLQRNVAIRRVTDFTESGDFRASVINTELDRLTAFAQQLSNRLDRAVRLADTDLSGAVRLPPIADRAGRVAAFDSAGDIVAVALVESPLMISALMESVLLASTQPAALGLLAAQAQSAELDAIAALTPTNGDVLTRAGGVWTAAAPPAAPEGVPTGAITMYGGAAASVPSGWLLKDGSTIGDVGSGADHEAANLETLFDAIKGLHGGTGTEDFASGDVVTLGDFRGRSPLGVNNAGLPNGVSGSYSTRNEGAAGGEEAHSLSGPEGPNHNHSYDRPGGLITGVADHGEGSDSVVTTITTGFSTGSTGSGTAHNTMHPFLVVNFIIKI